MLFGNILDFLSSVQLVLGQVFLILFAIFGFYRALKREWPRKRRSG